MIEEINIKLLETYRELPDKEDIISRLKENLTEEIMAMEAEESEEIEDHEETGKSEVEVVEPGIVAEASGEFLDQYNFEE